VDSGYQVGVAGAAGMDVKETERLMDCTTEEETIEVATAFMQLYRENAKYLDRPYKWVAKVGLDWVKEQIVEDVENRKALVARFDLSQTIYQKDPWEELAAEDEAPKFGPIANLTLEAAE
jgi:nitrite reductase (NADH) large subunit